MPPRIAPTRGPNPPRGGRGGRGRGAGPGGHVGPALGIAGEFIYICNPLS